MNEKQTWLSASEVARRLDSKPQKISGLAMQGILPRRATDGKYPWPATKDTFERWQGNRPERVIYSNGDFDKELSKMSSETPAPEIDKDDAPLIDMRSTGVDYNNLSLGEQVIHSIQNRIKGSEKLAYSWSRALKESIDARSAMLKLLEQEGKTLDRKAVDDWLYNASRHNRDMWLNWPQLVATEIAEEVGCDSNLLYGVLNRLVRANLDRIATIPAQFESDHVGSVSEGPEAPTDTST